VDFNRFTSDGSMDWYRFIFHVMTHPRTVGPLMRLGKDSRLAAVRLAGAVEKVLTHRKQITSNPA
jgi:hypothetical protein